MKALILNGSVKDDNSLDIVHEVVQDELMRNSYQVDSFILHDTEVAGCLGCFGCWVQTPGICVIDDAGREIARKVIQSDLVVLLTPVTFGGYSSELKKAMDRLIPLISPFFTKIQGEVHHKPRYDRYPSLIAVGVHPQPDEEMEQIFKTLVSRNAINFHSPSQAAGVMLSGQEWETVREEFRSLLAKARAEK